LLKIQTDLDGAESGRGVECEVEVLLVDAHLAREVRANVFRHPTGKNADNQIPITTSLETLGFLEPLETQDSLK